MNLPASYEAWLELEEERTAAPYSMADEHRAWHWMNGPGSCPWDACDPYAADDDYDDWVATPAAPAPFADFNPPF